MFQFIYVVRGSLVLTAPDGTKLSVNGGDAAYQEVLAMRAPSSWTADFEALIVTSDDNGPEALPILSVQRRTSNLTTAELEAMISRDAADKLLSTDFVRSSPIGILEQSRKPKGGSISTASRLLRRLPAGPGGTFIPCLSFFMSLRAGSISRLKDRAWFTWKPVMRCVSPGTCATTSRMLPGQGEIALNISKAAAVEATAKEMLALAKQAGLKLHGILVE